MCSSAVVHTGVRDLAFSSVQFSSVHVNKLTAIGVTRGWGISFRRQRGDTSFQLLSSSDYVEIFIALHGGGLDRSQLCSRFSRLQRDMNAVGPPTPIRFVRWRRHLPSSVAARVRRQTGPTSIASRNWSLFASRAVCA